MKQFMLALLLTAIPVATFTGYHIYGAPAAEQAATAQSLGDLTSLKAIVDDVSRIALTGDFAKAETRISDFETAWDDAEATMRPLNPDAWGVVDSAADAALKALRNPTPDPAKVTGTLSALNAVLANPVATTTGGTVGKVAGIDVTDSNGHAIPCETMLKMLQATLSGGKVAADTSAKAQEFAVKATERCNADDDVHADEFSAQGLALLAQ
jgi:hypothetical protein